MALIDRLLQGGRRLSSWTVRNVGNPKTTKDWFFNVGNALKDSVWNTKAPMYMTRQADVLARGENARDQVRSFNRAILMGKSAAKFTGRTALNIGRAGWWMGRKTASSAYRHPGLWIMGGSAVGATIGTIGGLRAGLRDQGYPVETRDMAPPVGGGPGYQSWVKGAGRPMSPNHLGASGLPLALHRTRHG